MVLTDETELRLLSRDKSTLGRDDMNPSPGADGEEVNGLEDDDVGNDFLTLLCWTRPLDT